MKRLSPLTHRRYLVPLVLVTLLFFLWGFARAILDVLNKHLQNQMDISITQSSLIQVTTYLGYFLMAIPAGLFINRYGYRRGVVLGLLLFGAGSLLMIPGVEAGTFRAFLLALFVIGCGLVFLETAANPYVTELGPAETSTSRLNLSQSVNGLGCLFATFAVGQWFFSSGNIESVVLPYAVMGATVLVVALIFTRANLPEIAHADDASARLSRSHIAELLLHRRLFVFGLAALLCYEIAEISINSYFINFVTGQGWMDDSTASMVITCALAFFMVGRFVGSWIMRSVAAETMLLTCGAGACRYRHGIDGGAGGHLSLRSHHVSHHLRPVAARTRRLHQERLVAADDDSHRRLWLSADGVDSRPRQPGGSLCDTPYRLCRGDRLCAAPPPRQKPRW